MTVFHISSREIGFRIHKLVFLIHKTTDKILNEKIGITHSQVMMMHAIKHRGEISQRDIAKFWQMTDAAVSRQVELLSGKKLIEKRENSNNRREHLVSLSVHGQKDLQKAFTVLDQKFEDLFQVLEENERLKLVESLDKLLKNICKNS